MAPPSTNNIINNNNNNNNNNNSNGNIMHQKYRTSFMKEAPTYKPTEKEFEDPLKYIALIREEAERFGICKICPPLSWQAPMAIETQTFGFSTRIQTVNELMIRMRSGENRSFRTEYCDYMGQHLGTPVERWPVFGGKKLDLQLLYEQVAIKRNGFAQINSTKQWRDIAKVLNTPLKGQSATFALKSLYQKWLLPFEKHKKALQLKMIEESKNLDTTTTTNKNNNNNNNNNAKDSASNNGAKNNGKGGLGKEQEPTQEEEELINAMLDLEFRCSGPAPKRPKLENVRFYFFSFARTCASSFQFFFLYEIKYLLNCFPSLYHRDWRKSPNNLRSNA